MPQVGEGASEPKPTRERQGKKRGPYRVGLTELEEQVYALRHSTMPLMKFSEIAERLEPFTGAGREEAPEPVEDEPAPCGVPLFLFLAGGVLGAVVGAILAPAYAGVLIGGGLGLGGGATLAHLLAPRVGEKGFWIRVGVVAAAVLVLGIVGSLVSGEDLFASLDLLGD